MDTAGHRRTPQDTTIAHEEVLFMSLGAQVWPLCLHDQSLHQLDPQKTQSCGPGQNVWHWGPELKVTRKKLELKLPNLDSDYELRCAGRSFQAIQKIGILTPVLLL